jgi:formate dehydrogenase major subunit
VKANVTEEIKEGSIWTTPHFAKASANKLTNDVLDPDANIPEYKAAAAEIDVDVEPAETPDATETSADD